MMTRADNYLWFTLVCFVFQLLFSSNSYATGFYDNFNDLNILNQNSKLFSTKKLNKKLTLFNFIYTNCASTCAVQTFSLSKLYRQLDPSLRKNIQFVSVSLDPTKDNPDRLKKFAKDHHADVPGWDFLALDFKSLLLLSKRLVVFKEDYGDTIYESIKHIEEGTNNNQYKLEEHTSTLWLIGPHGQVRQRYLGNPVDTNRLSNELAALHRVAFEN